MLTFLHLRKIYSRRSFVSIISRARMDGRGPWQHRDEVARTLAQRSNTFLYKWTLWQRRKTEQSVKSSQDTACNKMGQSEWLVIDQHIHLPRPIFTFLCCRVIWIICMARASQHCLSCLVQTDARENTGSDDQSGMCLFNSYHLTQIHKYTNTQIQISQTTRAGGMWLFNSYQQKYIFIQEDINIWKFLVEGVNFYQHCREIFVS